MKLFKQRPRTVEVVEYTGDNDEEIESFTGSRPWRYNADPGDFFVREGDFQYCRYSPKEFAIHYEPLL